MRRALAALGLAAALVLASATPAEAHRGIDWRTNRFRTNHDRPALRISYGLWQTARVRVKQLHTRGFEHDFSWWSRHPGCRGVGENIAYRNPRPDNPGLYFFRAWRDSPSHRRNMLGTWTSMASAVWVAPDGRMYAVQLFCLR